MSAGHKNTATASSASTKNTILASITPGDVCRVLIGRSCVSTTFMILSIAKRLMGDFMISVSDTTG